MMSHDWADAVPMPDGEQPHMRDLPPMPEAAHAYIARRLAEHDPVPPSGALKALREEYAAREQEAAECRRRADEAAEAAGRLQRAILCLVDPKAAQRAGIGEA